MKREWKHGKRGFMHVDAEQRMDGLFYVEHEHTNIHVQALINRPYCNRFGLQMHANRIGFVAKFCRMTEGTDGC